jgi:primosomal protein N'
VSRDYDDYARSEVGVPEDDYDEDQLLVSALAELTGEAKPKTSKTAEKSAAATRTSRPPTLKKSPHSVDVHAKHARHAKHAARAAASPKQLASARRVASDRSTLGSDERSLSAETQQATPSVSLSRAERAAAAKAAEQRSAAPAAPTERAAGGAWRSAFTETQTQVSYATRARSVFDGSSSAGVNGSGASGAYGQTVGGARAASLGAPRRAMDEAELAALVDAADAELDDFGPGAKPLARDSITA